MLYCSTFLCTSFHVAAIPEELIADLRKYWDRSKGIRF